MGGIFPDRRPGTCRIDGRGVSAKHNVVGKHGVNGVVAVIHLRRNPGKFLRRGNHVKALAVYLFHVFRLAVGTRPRRPKTEGCEQS